MPIELQRKHPYFDHTPEVIVKAHGNGFALSRPSLDYRGKTYKVSRMQYGWVKIHIPLAIEDVKYVVSDDSDEDVIYFNKQ